MLEPSGYTYPNRIARAFFAAMDDVMGQHGLSALLKLANMERFLENPPPDDLERQFDFSAIAALNIALEEMYGVRGGHGMALRIGQSSFARGLKSFGAMRAAADPAFRVLPLNKRLHYGLNGLASVLNSFTDQQSSVEITNGAFLFSCERSPYAWGRSADKPVCHMMVGILLESTRWVSNGYEFYIRETECCASGGKRCVFRVNQSAISEHMA